MAQLNAHTNGDQKVIGSNTAGLATFLSRHLIMKYCHNILLRYIVAAILSQYTAMTHYGSNLSQYTAKTHEISSLLISEEEKSIHVYIRVLTRILKIRVPKPFSLKCTSSTMQFCQISLKNRVPITKIVSGVIEKPVYFRMSSATILNVTFKDLWCYGHSWKISAFAFYIHLFILKEVRISG